MKKCLPALVLNHILPTNKTAGTFPKERPGCLFMIKDLSIPFIAQRDDLVGKFGEVLIGAAFIVGNNL